ncbi:lipase family protein [Paenibacillus oenotherae]|uniref:Lipase family protein n=2 Tax=Paenibacillus oenotherae TaxID=1435645 RepID=A0ABS7D422_9BACL|nr:lipase family protein [Paenibacillus oenotherae]
MDIRTALFLSAICEQTTTQFNNARHWFLVPSTYRIVGTFEADVYSNMKELFGFLLESDKAAILAFRGSGSAVDWVNDFIAYQVKFTPVSGGGSTHCGFTNVYMSARDRIMGLLDNIPRDKPLFITGHSLGGALATLAALDIASNRGPEGIIVYTFASPRVGDPQFARTYNRLLPNTFRIQNEHDIVPHLPPLIYQSPTTKKNYLYMHVKGDVKRSFRMGSVAGNHILYSYFVDLAQDAPHMATAICAYPPGWCPSSD